MSLFGKDSKPSDLPSPGPVGLAAGGIASNPYGPLNSAYYDQLPIAQYDAIYRQIAQTLTPSPLPTMGQLAYAKPVHTEQSAPVDGYRAFKLTDDGKLKGFRGVAWASRRLVAECRAEATTTAAEFQIYSRFRGWVEKNTDLAEKFRQDFGLERICADHIELNTCSCGIYGMGTATHPQMKEAQVIAHCLATGVVGLDAEGNFRASECQIEDITIIKAMVTTSRYFGWDALVADLANHYNVPVRVVDKLSDIEGSTPPVAVQGG